VARWWGVWDLGARCERGSHGLTAPGLWIMRCSSMLIQLFAVDPPASAIITHLFPCFIRMSVQ
jgi:hypothetical protein